MAITILFLHCRRCQNSMKQFSPEKWKYASSKNITTITTCMSHNSLLEHGHFDYSLILQFCISFVVDEGNWVLPICFFHPFHLQKWQYTTLTLPIHFSAKCNKNRKNIFYMTWDYIFRSEMIRFVWKTAWKNCISIKGVIGFILLSILPW